MNLIEAIKSGRRFKHKFWRGYDDNDWADPAVIMSDDDNDWADPAVIMSDLTVKLTMPVGALIADDWEVEEVSCYAGSAMITREQFDAAWSKIWPHDAYNDSLNSINCYTKLERDALAKELGL